MLPTLLTLDSFPRHRHRTDDPAMPITAGGPAPLDVGAVRSAARRHDRDGREPAARARNTSLPLPGPDG